MGKIGWIYFCILYRVDFLVENPKCPKFQIACLNDTTFCKFI